MSERTDAPGAGARKTGETRRRAAEYRLHIAAWSLVGKRVMLVDQPHQPLLQYMGVDLRGGNIGVAEQLLHGAQVGAVLQKMAGEGMAKHMRRNLGRSDAGARGKPLQ